MNRTHAIKQAYLIQVKRIDENTVEAWRDPHQLILNAKKGDNRRGFNAVETLLAAHGTCILTNINDFSKKMRLNLDDATVELQALRTDTPPKVIAINYKLTITSAEPIEKLEELYALSIKWGTVSNTLADALKINGKLIIVLPK